VRFIHQQGDQYTTVSFN